MRRISALLPFSISVDSDSKESRRFTIGAKYITTWSSAFAGRQVVVYDSNGATIGARSQRIMSRRHVLLGVRTPCCCKFIQVFALQSGMCLVEGRCIGAVRDTLGVVEPDARAVEIVTGTGDVEMMNALIVLMVMIA